MKKIILSTAFLLAATSFFTQNIVFTDANFKAALLAHNPVIDTSNDGEISIDEAEFFAHGLSVSNSGISDLNGLEHFINMPEFYCNGNNISSISLSTLAALTDLSCTDNTISVLDLSLNPNIIRLNCFNNNITTLDASLNTGMVLLSCFNNQLTTINVQNGNNTNMQFSGTLNPNACIQVDNVTYSQGAFNWNKDASATYTLSCSTTGIEENKVNFSFYPNPVQNELNVNTPSFAKFELIDLTSKLVLTSYQSVSNVSALKKGVYFLKVYDIKGNFSTEKIIKQ